MTEFADTVKSIFERLRVHVANDPELRRSIRDLVNTFLGEETSAQPSEPPHNGVHAAADEQSASEATATFAASPRVTYEEPPRSGPLPELTFARTSVSSPRPEFEKAQAPPTDDDLTMIESRTRLKGNACRWAAERRRRLAAGAVVSVEIAPFDRDLITQAREIPGCFLWMCHLSAPEPRDVSDYETLGHGFDNLCRATSLVRRLREAGHADEADLHRSLDLLAESQSAVRAGIAALNGPIDNDQMAIFLWLRQTASDERYYIRRHMRLDDPADRFAWQDLEQRLASLD